MFRVQISAGWSQKSPPTAFIETVCVSRQNKIVGDDGSSLLNGLWPHLPTCKSALVYDMGLGSSRIICLYKNNLLPATFDAPRVYVQH